MTAAALLLVALMANQHRVGRAVARKTLVRSIKCAFPGWLMDIVLLLQSENVQVALQKSQEHVPPVLRRDLDILVGQLEMEPESVLPYHRFTGSTFCHEYALFRFHGKQWQGRPADRGTD